MKKNATTNTPRIGLPATLLALALAGAGCGGGDLSDGSGAPATLLWSARPSVLAADWQAVWGSGSDLFLASKGDAVAHSTDAGATWTVAATGANGTAGGPDFRDIAGTSGGDVWLAGTIGTDRSVLLHSADRGASWQRRDAGLDGVVRAVWALDPQRVLAATGDGKLWRSTDGGAGWSVAYTGKATALHDVWGLPSGEVYAVGEQAEAAEGATGIVLASADGGATWSEVAAAPVGTLWRVWGTPNGNAVYAAGAGATVAWTLDHALTWHVQGKAPSTPDIDLTNVWVTPDDGAPFFASPRGLVRNIDYLASGAIQFGTEGLPAAADGQTVPAAVWGTRTDDVWAVGAHGALWHRP